MAAQSNNFIASQPNKRTTSAIACVGTGFANKALAKMAEGKVTDIAPYSADQADAPWPENPQTAKAVNTPDKACHPITLHSGTEGFFSRQA